MKRNMSEKIDELWEVAARVRGGRVVGNERKNNLFVLLPDGKTVVSFGFSILSIGSDRQYGPVGETWRGAWTDCLAELRQCEYAMLPDGSIISYGSPVHPSVLSIAARMLPELAPRA